MRRRDAQRARVSARVSRETLSRLDALVALLDHWAPRINLVAPSTLRDVWSRHIDDSLQLLEAHAPLAGPWVDLGSGAGFPGLVVAAARPDIAVTLVESDHRKCAFLTAATHAMGLSCAISPTRAEILPAISAHVVSARALAPLPRLLPLAAPLLAPGGVLLAAKGRTAVHEVSEARQEWCMTLRSVPSRTAPDAVILVITDLARAAD